jgi:hypothetical protein
MGEPETIVQAAPIAPLAPYPQLSADALDCLRLLAARYVWWKKADDAMQYPHRVAAQVMNLDTWQDWVAMWEAVGDDYLRSVLQHAEAGQLDARSWHYWHYRLGLAELPTRPVPPMPVRKIA